MRFSLLAAIIASLVNSYGVVHPEDHLHFLELCAGSHRLTDCALDLGLKAHAMDVTYSRHQDLLESVGFLSALQSLRRVIQGGLLWLGIPCSSWIWLARSTTRRCRIRPKGSKKFQKVRKHNRLVRRLCFMLEYCRKKGIRWIIEQPHSSLLPLYKPLEALMKRHSAKIYEFPLGMHGANTEKRTILISNAPWMAQFPCPCMTWEKREQLQQLQTMKGIRLVKKYRDSKGQSRVVGTKDLTSSQVYPWQFSMEVMNLFNQNLQRQRRTFPDTVRPDQGLVFADVDPCSSESELEDILETSGHTK